MQGIAGVFGSRFEARQAADGLAHGLRLFPEPLGPMMPTNSPFFTLKETSSRRTFSFPLSSTPLALKPLQQMDTPHFSSGASHNLPSSVMENLTESSYASASGETNASLYPGRSLAFADHHPLYGLIIAYICVRPLDLRTVQERNLWHECS